jgi:hypothetical protein
MKNESLVECKRWAELPASATFIQLLHCIDSGKKANGDAFTPSHLSEVISDLVQSPLTAKEWKVGSADIRLTARRLHRRLN